MTNLNSKFTYTRDVIVDSASNDRIPIVINVGGGTPTIDTKGNHVSTTTCTGGDAAGLGGVPTGGATAARNGAIGSSNSNSGFEAVNSNLHPKIAELL